MSETKLVAYRISAGIQGKRNPIPKDFLTFLTKSVSSNFADFWRPAVQLNVTSHNLQNARWVPGNTGESSIWEAILVEVHPKEGIDLMNLQNGNTNVMPIPENHGESQTWSFCILPEKNLLILEVKGRRVEGKLEEYLGIRIHEWSISSATVEKNLDSIYIEAIPKENDPIGFLRKNPELATISLKIKAKSIDTQFGFFGNLFSGLSDNDKDYLVLKVEISSSKRGGNLPEISLTTTADILEKIDTDSLMQASVKSIDGGRRAKARHLLNAVTEKTLTNLDPESIQKSLCDFAREVDIGDGMELLDE
ncbi:MAG: hypothetical protein V4591_08850 [Bdellovibrionota bacterium]